MPIIKLDNQKVIVCLKDDLEEWGWDCRSSRLPVAVDKKRSSNGSDLSPMQILSASALYDKSDRSEDRSESTGNSPEKENRYPTHSLESALKTRRGSNPKESLYDCNISFSDDTKSEAFFRNLMLSSQHMPVQKESLSLTPKLQKTCAKTVSNSQSNGVPNHSVKPIPHSRTINSNKDTNISECDLSPIERLNSRPSLINDIDLDATLKSIQLYNMRNDIALTPSAIPYPPSIATEAIDDLSPPNFTPPAPLSRGQLATTPSSPPPLPPKAMQRDRGPPPRPPISRLAVNNHLLANSTQNKNCFVQNIDQIIDSNVSFV